MLEPLKLLDDLFQCAVRSAQPMLAMAPHLPDPPKGKTVVVGAGKAAASMARALDNLWPAEASISGAVVTRYGHIPPKVGTGTDRIAVYEAAHPVPDAASVVAAGHILELVHGLTSDDLVICLMSGGASSLLTSPIEGVSLAEKQWITKKLLVCGAPIDDMNVVRQSLSRVKAGQLAYACGNAPVVTLAISDVPGDKPEIIGSGPTVQCFAKGPDALEILDRHRIEIPHGVRQAIERHALERSKQPRRFAGNDRFGLIATPTQALMAAAKRARDMGLEVHVLGDSIEGESKDVARFHADIARAVSQGRSSMQRPCVILSGGETTVEVSEFMEPRGRGGRAGEFCLALAQALEGSEQIWALAADTDGIDGCENNAGAFVRPDTVERAKLAGLSTVDFLKRHDSYCFFRELGDLYVTGPTYTNVNDFRAILIA